MTPEAMGAILVLFGALVAYRLRETIGFVYGFAIAIIATGLYYSWLAIRNRIRALVNRK